MVGESVRILITGSRDWTNQNAVFGAIHTAIADYDADYTDVVIIHGACPTGADAIADTVQFGTIKRYPADWEKHGKAAGPIRNKTMVTAGADVCLAFIKNGSLGATGCALLAEKAGIPTRRFLA